MSLLGPPNLTAPYAFSVLGWGPAVAACVAFTFASAWCGVHAAQLFHLAGGARCESYGAAARAALSRRGPAGARAAAAINGFQHALNLANAVISVLLSAQLLQSFCANAAGRDDGYCPAMPSYAAWTAVGGAMQLALLLAAPYPTHLVAFLSAGAVAFAFYQSTGLAIAVNDRAARRPTYTLSSDPLAASMEALNGIGILLFLFSSNIMLEIQSTIRPTTEVGGSTTGTMTRAVLISHFALIGPINMIIGCVGYWALGSGAPQLLSSSRSTHVHGLQAAATMAALLQALATSQLYLLPPLHAVESWIAARCACCQACAAWLVLPPPAAEEGGGSKAVAALRALSAAMSPPAALSPGPSFTGGERHHGSVSAWRMLGAKGTADGDVSMCRVFSAALQGPPLAVVLLDGTDTDTDGGGAGAASSGGACDPEAGCAPAAAAVTAADALPQPSPLLMLLVRGGVMAAAVLIGIAAPFIASFIGLFGGIGFGLMSYPMFTLLYLLARGKEVPRWERAAAWAFTGLAAAACCAATVGSVWTLARSIHSFHFLRAAPAAV